LKPVQVEFEDNKGR